MHYDLPIYRAAYKFSIKLFEVVKTFPREYKYTIGQDMRRDSIALVRLIICANKYRAERVSYLNTLQEEVELVKMQIRMCFDMRVMTVNHHSSLSDMLEAISKQVAGWKNVSTKNS